MCIRYRHVEYDFVTEIDVNTHPYTVRTEMGHEYQTRSIIASTGASPRYLEVPGEKELTGKGVSYCATCDGFFFRDQHIAVIGGGDSAMEEAHFLARFASKVSVVHRRDRLRASAIMQRRAFDNPKIDFVWDSVVEEYLGNGSLQGLRLRNLSDGTVSDLEVTGTFIAIGHRPNTELFEGQLEMKANGYLVTRPGTSLTSVDGVFAVGDVQDDVYRQAVTAAGSGCMGALDAERWPASPQDPS